MNRLAIVIPAYKSRYFQQTLESILKQSCKDFNLYIGDDCSPDDIKSLVDKYCNNNSVVFKRFEDNLGGKDLVGHWERCIDMTRDEEYIWLFSDDDVMSDKCVEGFFEILRKHERGAVSDKIFRFNLSVADSDLNVLQKYETPSEFSVEYFLESYFITHKLRNKAVEFIFSKESYYKKGRFVNFPLAWGSDTSTMLKLGQISGFVTVEKGDVFWRASKYNVSSGSDIQINQQKPDVTVLFLRWIIDFIRIYKGSRFHRKLIYHILYFLPSLNNIKEIYNEKDKISNKIPVWIIFIKMKRFLRVYRTKELIRERFLN